MELIAEDIKIIRNGGNLYSIGTKKKSYTLSAEFQGFTMNSSNFMGYPTREQRVIIFGNTLLTKDSKLIFLKNNIVIDLKERKMYSYTVLEIDALKKNLSNRPYIKLRNNA
jgi:hypothetical protein